MTLSNEILSDITVFMKYAKYLPDLERRETWHELVTRNKQMHIKKYPELIDEISNAYQMVYDKKVLPSMRSLQFAGKPIEISPNRIFNCAYLPIDDYRSFGETMFLLLGGTGVGYSVQKHHVDKLPDIRKPNPKKKRRYLVADSIEGWADSIKVLIKSYTTGATCINFDFSDIRQKGARLVTSGGKAPGPQPLKECLVKLQGILDAKEDGDRLTPIEVHDMICHIADAVLAGGIRRAALISLFSADDNEMISCKAGSWWETNPQRGRANNSAVLMRHKLTKEFFMDIWKRVELSGAGEPGIYLTNDKDWGTNPSLRKGTRVWTTEGVIPIEELEDKTFSIRNLDGQISKAKCWLSGRGKKLFKVTLEGNHEYYATAEHEWPIWDGEKYIKVSTPDIEAGHMMKYQSTDKITDGVLGDYNDGFLSGWQLGDGWTSEKKDGTLLHGLIVSSKDDESNISNKLLTHLKESVGCQANLISRSINHKELNTTNKRWDEFQNKFGYGHKSQGLPSTTWTTASEQFRRGLVDALFSSDGSVEKSKKRIAFHSAHEKLAKDLSDLLGLYGVKHSLRFVENGFKGVYKLDITEGKSIRLFKTLFTLSVNHKQERIDAYEFKYNITSNNQIKVKSVEETDLEEDVWDITVYDSTHAFQLPHVVTGNCCEIALRPFQFCNLCEVNVSDIDSQEDFENRVRVASFIGTLQAGYTNFHYLRDVWKRTTEKDALIGVSMTGIASGTVLKYDMKTAAKIVKAENERVVGIIGINKAARTTCVKPAGCLTTNTEIRTNVGNMTMEEIFDLNGYSMESIDDMEREFLPLNQKIHIYNEKNEKEVITKLFVNGYDDVFDIVFEDGTKVSATKDHKFLTTNRGWVTADSLTTDDDILNY